MDNSLKTGQYMKTILCEDVDFNNLISSDAIFPIVVTVAETEYPYITYTRDNITPQYTKAAPFGGWTNDVAITYRIYTGNNHDLGENIANAMRNALEWKSYEDEDIRINPIELTSSFEYFNEDGFCQQLTFSTQVE